MTVFVANNYINIGGKCYSADDKEEREWLIIGVFVMI